jgi:ribosomal protein RSM22 (predicted rRNA methylase)
MELPPLLRAAVDRALSGRRAADLAAAAAALSERYRQELRDGGLHVASDDDALAYLAVRLPATYAAVRASFDAIKQARPDFAPRTALDIGAGPGTALWAAADCWPALADAVLIEASPVFRACGEALARATRQQSCGSRLLHGPRRSTSSRGIRREFRLRRSRRLVESWRLEVPARPGQQRRPELRLQSTS